MGPIAAKEASKALATFLRIRVNGGHSCGIIAARQGSDDSKAYRPQAIMQYSHRHFSVLAYAS
jgi:hypothetical protein